MLLGDRVSFALNALGVTPVRLLVFLSGCCCKERRERLNALDAWARRVLSGKVDGALRYLNNLIGSEE